MAGWRLEALWQLASYAAAALLAVALPLHILSRGFGVAAPYGSWVPWLILVAAGVHGANGLRSVLYDYVHSEAGRRLVDLAAAGLAAFIVAVGAWGLASLG